MDRTRGNVLSECEKEMHYCKVDRALGQAVQRDCTVIFSGNIQNLDFLCNLLQAICTRREIGLDNLQMFLPTTAIMQFCECDQSVLK